MLVGGGIGGAIVVGNPAGAANGVPNGVATKPAPKPAPPAVGKNWHMSTQNVQPNPRPVGARAAHERHLPPAAKPGKQPGFESSIPAGPGDGSYLDTK